MKLKGWLLLTLMLASVAGCATSGNFCDVNSAYRPQAGESYSEKNKRWIVAFNEYGEKHCGWNP